MVEVVYKPREGFERLFDEICAMEANNDTNKQKEIEAAINGINEKYAERENQIAQIKQYVSVIEEVEIPDENADVSVATGIVNSDESSSQFCTPESTMMYEAQNTESI